MVYMEYETDFEINEDYRHYAIANESQSLARLPYIIALPEDREIFTRIIRRWCLLGNL